MIYAKVDVKLRDHERAHRAGAAMATWTWALLYAREQETDGYIPDVTIRGAWVGEKEARRHAGKLVEVGLWEVTDGGWRICRYDAKNDTKAVIDENRARSRERMGRVRANKQRTHAEPPGSEQLAVPRSRSGSPFGSGSLPTDQEPPDRSPTPPAWFADAAASAAMVVGDISDLPARWASYRSSRSRKGWAKNHEDAVGWLCDVVRSERERRKANSSPRNVAEITKQPFDPDAPWIKLGDTGS